MPRKLTRDALKRTERNIANLENGRDDVLFLFIEGVVSVVASDGRAIFGHLFGAHSLMYDDANLAYLMQEMTGDEWTNNPQEARKAFIQAQGGNRLQVVSYTRKGYLPVGWADAHAGYHAPETVAEYSGAFGTAPKASKASRK